MASSDTDDDILICSTLLIGTIVNERKRKKAKTYNRSIWTREWIAQRYVFKLQICRRQFEFSKHMARDRYTSLGIFK